MIITGKVFVYTKVTSHMPQRFGDYVVDKNLTDDQKCHLETNGWLKRELTETEIKRLSSLPSKYQENGCLGDLLDSFHTMYGKEVFNKKES